MRAPRKRVIDFNKVVLEDMEHSSSGEEGEHSQRATEPQKLLALPSPKSERSGKPSLRLRDRIRGDQQERATSPPLLELREVRSSPSPTGGGGGSSRPPRRRRGTGASAQGEQDAVSARSHREGLDLHQGSWCQDVLWGVVWPYAYPCLHPVGLDSADRVL
jgi:hypothetical protein